MTVVPFSFPTAGCRSDAPAVRWSEFCLAAFLLESATDKSRTHFDFNKTKMIMMMTVTVMTMITYNSDVINNVDFINVFLKTNKVFKF
jgi:hypothetical protein